VPNNLKQYDAFQVLRSVFDVDKNCLRVCVVDGGSGGPIEVIIDHTTDSIRLGDGTTLFTSTTVGSKTGLDVAIINSPIVTTPKITHINTLASTETSHSFDTDMNRFEMIVEGFSRIQYAYANGDSGTTYDIVYPGARLVEDNIQAGSNVTIYFQTRFATKVIIKEWK
jgi:hypothetical protein